MKGSIEFDDLFKGSCPEGLAHLKDLREFNKSSEASTSNIIYIINITDKVPYIFFRPLSLRGRKKATRD